jgi:hypothetical protein
MASQTAVLPSLHPGSTLPQEVHDLGGFALKNHPLQTETADSRWTRQCQVHSFRVLHFECLHSLGAAANPSSDLVFWFRQSMKRRRVDFPLWRVVRSLLHENTSSKQSKRRTASLRPQPTEVVEKHCLCDVTLLCRIRFLSNILAES